MFEQLLSSPLIAVGLLVLVVYMAAVYFTQKERAKVHHMKGRKGFTPKWSSGRRHRARRRAGAEGGFRPQWDRDRPGDRWQDSSEAYVPEPVSSKRSEPPNPAESAGD